MRVSPSGSVAQGWALRVQKCAVGRSQEVSSSVPTRTATKPPGGAVPGFAPLQTQVPHSAQTHRFTVRPLSAVRWKDRGSASRSEEHTSELQSRQYLVCRLLLEKKKKSSQ